MWLEVLQRTECRSFVVAVLNLTLEYLARVPVLLTRLIFDAFRALITHKGSIIQKLHDHSIYALANVDIAFTAGARAIV